MDTARDDGAVFPLSMAAERLWRADQAIAGRLAYHFGLVVTLDGPLDAGALEAALGDVAARHEILRAHLVEVAGRPMFSADQTSRGAAVTLTVTDSTGADPQAVTEAAAGHPLDPFAGPLWRAELHRFGPGQHRLVLIVHHLIADDPTLTLLLDDLAAAYRSRHAGRPPVLAPAGGYRGYVGREQAFLAGPRCAEQVSYWAGQVAGTPRLELPTDRPRDPGSAKPGALAPLTIPAATGDALRELAREHGATLVQVLLAGYAVMLHRYSGQDEFAVGLPVSTRRGAQDAEAAGLYANTVPIRISLAGNPTFGDLVDQVRGTVFGALGAACVPLDLVAEAVRDQGGAQPLFDVVFTMSRGRKERLDLPGITARVRRPYTGHARFDLELGMVDAEPGTALDGYLAYDRDLFGAASARRLADSFVTLLADAAVTPGRRIGALTLWRGAPAAGRVTPLRADQVDAQSKRVDELFTEVAAAAPERVALIDASDGRELRYGELAARARGVATELASLGVGRGDFVGITLPRSTDLIVAILGVLSAGAGYVPLDPGYPVGRLSAMNRAAPVKVIIGKMPADLGVPCLELLDSEAATAPAVRACVDDPAYVMFTSGSTGAPKAVVVPHRAIVRLVRGANFAEMGPDERWLNAASPAFDASTLELWAPLLNGGIAVVVPGLCSVADLGRAIERYQVSAGFITTGLFNVIVDSDVEILRPFRQLLTGGEAASPDHFRRALAVVPVVSNVYGPTENTTFTCGHMMRSPAEVISPLPIGTPVTGTTMYVADAYQNLLPPGAVGELLTGGEGLATGYAGSPGLTADRFVPSPVGPPGARLYRTGDFGRIDDEGVVHFTGRRDDQVKVRGFRIELAGVERALAEHPLVDQVAVTVYTDPTGDRRLVGYTVGAAGRDELIEYLRGRLPEYMIPTQWVQLDAMPLGVTGKVDRRALPEPGAEPPAAPARARTLVEELLIAWYCELLGVADVGPDTDFFAAGGHSLFASRLVARIRATFGVEMPLAAVFANPRLGDLAAEVAAAPNTGLPPIEAGGGTQRRPLSFAQERMWFLQRYAPASARYHVPVSISLRGELDPAALGRAVQGLADRHPVLRTVFGEEGGQPHQTIRPAGTELRAAEFDLSGLDAELRDEALDEIAAGLFTAPFDLTAELPIRVALVRMDPRWHELLLVVHHIAVDGWSLPLIWDDLARGYVGPLPAAGEVTYADFAQWQRSALTGAAAASLESFWRDYLAGVPDRLVLPGDVTGESEGTGADDTGVGAGRGGARRITLPTEVVDGAREVARQAKATPYAALLAAYGVLLARRTGVEDLVIGTPVASRTQAAVAGMIGLFVNTLPVRIDVSGDPSYAELVARVSRSVVSALEHAAMPFERIVELAGLPRTDDQQQPLVQMLFAVQPELPRRFLIGDVEAEVSDRYLDAAKVDLTVSLFDDGTEVSGFIEYRSSLYSEEFAAGFVSEYTELLARLGARPDAPVSAAGLLSGQESAEGCLSGQEGGAATVTAAAKDDAEDLCAGVAAVWEALLGSPVADGEANFFRLGGHSLTAVQAIAGIRDVLGREVPLRDIFEHPTLAGFTERVALAPQAGQRPPLRALPGRQRAPLAPAQLRHWRAATSAADTVMPLVLRLRGALDVAALERALTLIATRHTVLRTTFDVGADGPEQRIGPPARVRVPVTPVTPAGLAEVMARSAQARFELSAAPPWRAELFRLAGDDHYLMLGFHPLVCDDRALRLLIGELAAYLTEGAAPPAPVRVQYGDYAAWRAEFSPARSGAPGIEAPRLGTPHHAGSRGHGGEHEVELEPRVATALRKFAADEGATLSSVLTAVFATALGQATGRTRVLVGSLEPGRDDGAETERMLGCFASCVALSCDLSGAATWRDVVPLIRDAVAVPIDDDGEVAGLDGLCAVGPAPELPARLGPAEVTLVRWPEERGGAPLELRLTEQRDGRLTGVLRFDGECCGATEAARVAALWTAMGETR